MTIKNAVLSAKIIHTKFEAVEALTCESIASYMAQPHDMAFFAAILARIVQISCNPAKCVLTLTWAAFGQLTKRDLLVLQDCFMALECAHVEGVAFAIVEAQP